MEYRYREQKELIKGELGNIPKSWNQAKAQYYFDVFAGGTPSTNEPKYWDGDIPWINSGEVQNCYITNVSRYITNQGLKESSTKLIPKNTTVLAMTGATCGNVGYLQFDSTANQSVMAFVPKYSYNSKFLYYYLMCQSQQIEYYKTGGAQGGINVDNGKKLYINIPLDEEQEKIANFLDKKTSKFNSIISKKEALIEKLEEAKKSFISEVVTGKMKVIKNDDGYDLVKRSNDEMKDSGVEWLGEIPKDWEVKKFSHIIKISNGQVNPKIEPYSNMILIAPNHIRSNMGKIIALETANSQGADSGKYFCNKGDIIYSKIRPNLCKVCIAPLDCLCSADMYPMKTDSKLLNQEYLLWILLSDNFTKYVVLDSDRVAMPKVNRESLSKFKIPVPTLQEQNLLNTVLKDKDKNIDCLISKIKLQIEKLKEAKQSLISEAVTGKIEIMD